MNWNEWVQLSWAESETGNRRPKETDSAKVWAKSLRTCLSCLHFTSSALHFKNFTLEFYAERMGGQGRFLRRVNLRLPVSFIFMMPEHATRILLHSACCVLFRRKVQNNLNHTQLIELSARRPPEPGTSFYRLYRLMVLIALCQKWACSVDSFCC